MRRTSASGRRRRTPSHVWGQVLAVRPKPQGWRVAADTAAGATALPIRNGEDAEGSGTVQVNGQVVAWSSWDAATGALQLVDALAADADAGDNVWLYDPKRSAVVGDFEADVDVDDWDGEPPTAILEDGLEESLPVGPREPGEGEWVRIFYDDREDEWFLDKTRGLGSVRGRKWEDDDTYVITEADVADSLVVHQLRHRNVIERSVDLYASGESQPASNYAMDYQSGTLTMSLDGWEEGVVLDPRYQYRDGTSERGLFVPWGATGWKYLQVAMSNATDRSSVGFDDSGWSAGAAAFGSGAGAPYTPSTAWAPNTSLWVRRTIGPGRDFEIEVLVEDNCRIYWNGVDIGGANNADDGVVTATTLISVPSDVAHASGTNVIAIRANDETPSLPASTVFLDIQVKGVLI